jgi:hypothetical protein
MPYTGQAPPLISKEIESMLEENRTARICSHNKDGTIHVVPVAYRYMDGQIVIASLSSSRKTRNIKRNNDVTVLIELLTPLEVFSFMVRQNWIMITFTNRLFQCWKKLHQLYQEKRLNVLHKSISIQ